jgi:hypothetical protein
MDDRYIRGKAFNVALLAAGYSVQGEVEQACAKGREAVDRAVALHSARAVTYVRNLLIDLSGYEDVEVCREFRTYAEARLPSLRCVPCQNSCRVVDLSVYSRRSCPPGSSI